MPSLLNDQLDDQLLFERQESFAGGEDNYRRSTLIDPDQCQKLVNMLVRDNYEAWTRFGADPFAESATVQIIDAPMLADDGSPLLADDGSPLLSDEDQERTYTTAPVMALKYFDTPSNKYLLAMCNGVLKALGGYNLNWDTTTYEAADDLRVEIEQGIDTCLISDGVNPLTIIDSALTITTCGTDPINDPPVGANILCWHTGRMFAAGFTATPDTIWVSNRLAFGDGDWNGTTRSFRIGSGDGDPIMAMQSLQGFTLAVFKANSIWLCQTDPTNEPADFQASADVQSLGFGVGAVGKRAVCAVANDVFFMAQDGVRTLQRMQAAAGQWQLTAPISQPVQQYIDRINGSARSGIVASSYKELVAFAIPLDSSSVNNCVLVFNTRLGKWMGAWTGWTPMVFCKTRFNAVEQWLFGDSTGLVNYWKDGSDTNNANTYLDNGHNITGQKLWTRAFVFGDPVSTKDAYNCELRFTSGNAVLNVAAIMDLVQTKTFQQAMQPSGDVLGVGRLGSFRLSSVAPVKLKKSLRALSSFNEVYLKIEAEAGWFKLRSITVAAFPKAYNG